MQSFAHAQQATGTLDGNGAGDRDQPYFFGRRPRSDATGPFTTRQYSRLLVQTSLDETWTPIAAMDDGGRYDGLGWSVADMGGQRVLAHSGSVDTAGSYFLVAPDQRIAVGVLANLSGDEKAEVAMDVLRIAFGNEPSAPTPTVDWRLAASRFTPNLDVWSAYLGDYQGPRGILRVCRDEDQLHIASGGSVFDLVPLSDTTFVLLGDETASDEVPAEFRRDSNGSVVFLIKGQPLGIKK
jgi:CubicO group peptidase (beta-lactamase class C family)